MPSSRAARTMRTAISPRLAMRSLRMVMDGLAASNVDLGNRLTGHHGLLVLGEETYELAGQTRLHLGERLHDLDQADPVVLRDGVAVGFVGRLAVEDAGKG